MEMLFSSQILVYDDKEKLKLVNEKLYKFFYALIFFSNFRAFDHIFETVSVAESTKFLLHASYCEIYNEEIRDLLGKDAKQKLDLKEHPEKGVYVNGKITTVDVSIALLILRILQWYGVWNKKYSIIKSRQQNDRKIKLYEINDANFIFHKNDPKLSTLDIY